MVKFEIKRSIVLERLHWLQDDCIEKELGDPDEMHQDFDSMSNDELHEEYCLSGLHSQFNEPDCAEEDFVIVDDS